MKNLLWLLLFVISTGVVFGQKTFEVQDFSDDFYGKVYLEQPSEVFSKGWVAIYTKKTNRQLIKVVADELTSPDEEGKIKANVKELPYGEQSMIMYEDFNFDSIKDFAIMDGQNSCYHGPSFKIYLGTKVKNKFVLNPAFTTLAQEYCGMFEVNAEKKTLSTMVKSGCCWHQFSEYIIVGNAPKAVKIIEEDATKFPLLEVSTETWNGKKMVKTTSRKLDANEENGIKVLFSFKTTTGGDEIALLSSEEMLYYVFINEKQDVDFAYPTDSESEQEEPVFTFESNANQSTLSFTNKNATYKIYETPDGKIGVRVDAGAKSSDISGNPSTRKGSLSQLKGEKLTNVVLKK
jgi:hypothetical protein